MRSEIDRETELRLLHYGLCLKILGADKDWSQKGIDYKASLTPSKEVEPTEKGGV